MSPDSKTFLAASVLNDGKIVGLSSSLRSVDVVAYMPVLDIVSIPESRTQSA